MGRKRHFQTASRSVYRIENLDAAISLSTDEVWPGGSGGFSLTGSETQLGELGVWDANGVRTSHQEFGGRVTQMDGASGTHYHSTHVAGTLVAAGVLTGTEQPLATNLNRPFQLSGQAHVRHTAAVSITEVY